MQLSWLVPSYHLMTEKIEKQNRTRVSNEQALQDDAQSITMTSHVVILG